MELDYEKMQRTYSIQAIGSHGKYFDVLHKMRKAKNSNELYEQKYQELKKKYDLDL